ncbi:MAG: hypothetical protein M0P71_00190 [Melioribacteraceae bacterium]|nr:hypothetical protein [Melioribacteraceae bacterium]
MISKIILIVAISAFTITAQNKLTGNSELDRKIAFDKTYAEKKSLLN